MATNIYAELYYEEAQRYADLTGIKHDLERARDFARIYLNQKKRPVADIDQMDILESLGIASLIKYWRCFSHGKRKKLTSIIKDILSELSEELNEAHKLFEDWRNKNVSHSVDETEQNIPHARYWIERKELGFESIGCGSSRLLTLSIQDATNMVTLAEHHLQKVDVILGEEQERLLAFVNSKPMDEVLEQSKHFKHKPMRIGKDRKDLEFY